MSLYLVTLIWTKNLHRSYDDKQTFTLDRSKGFIFFFIQFCLKNKIYVLLIKCTLSFKMTFTFIILYSRIFHIPSCWLAPLEYNIKVKGSCSYFFSYFISRKVTHGSCNFSPFSFSHCFLTHVIVHTSLFSTTAYLYNIYT